MYLYFQELDNIQYRKENKVSTFKKIECKSAYVILKP